VEFKIPVQKVTSVICLHFDTETFNLLVQAVSDLSDL
jgi:hypothetical protein